MGLETEATQPVPVCHADYEVVVEESRHGQELRVKCLLLGHLLLQATYIRAELRKWDVVVEAAVRALGEAVAKSDSALGWLSVV